VDSETASLQNETWVVEYFYFVMGKTLPGKEFMEIRLQLLTTTTTSKYVTVWWAFNFKKIMNL